MPHTMVTFRLHRSGVILLVVFGLVLAALIYVAGYMTAARVTPKNVARSTAGVPSPRTPATAVPRSTAKVPSAQKAPQPSIEQRVTSVPSEPLTLRIAIHTTEEDAKAQVASLTAQGLQPAIVQAPTTSGVTLHTVIVGRYETRADANAAAAQLQRRLGFMPVIIPAPPL